MRTLVLVACSQTKAGHTTAAEHLYTSQLFKASARWAKANGDDWLILSAKHGLVEPTQELEPYDQRLTGDKHAKRAWGFRVQAGFAGWCLDQDEAGNPVETIQKQPGGVKQVALRIIVLAGKDYVANLPQWMQERCEQPLAGKQIGERLRWLKQQNEAAENAKQPLLF